MLRKTKSFIFGFFACLLITGTSAYAMEPTMTEIYLRKITYMFDGIEKKPPQGSEGFIYQGSIYVPLRFVSESMNKDIGWDDTKSTVWIGKSNDDDYFSHQRPTRVEGDLKFEIGVASIGGTKYSHRGFKVSFPEKGNQGMLQFNLAGQYSKFDGFLGIDDYTKNSSALGALKIIGDNRELLNFMNLKGGDQPKRFEVDLAGISTLQILYTKDTNSNLTIDIADAILHHK
ncbi:NPCBM/NEW2 domain-containing protein [Paenibacillus sp. OK003]|uniref:NPCBM/NEW2 domain-containing protein n=1 Tax=Paenibacillus sp. OK003 TaxID=1884380 RepID=UPI0008D47F11|nr:NPCBM/NEW2 domain-containing protein [Paenibacillus sp. OK003]SEL78983.1 Copper amine oxidase N-terminal domain-containing protein [Paenibacillus sp. OK003]